MSTADDARNTWKGMSFNFSLESSVSSKHFVDCILSANSACSSPLDSHTSLIDFTLLQLEISLFRHRGSHKADSL